MVVLVYSVRPFMVTWVVTLYVHLSKITLEVLLKLIHLLDILRVYGLRHGEVLFQTHLARLGLMAAIKGRMQLVLQDRKSTRLNSSHVKISYAVFCLKKKSTV